MENSPLAHRRTITSGREDPSVKPGQGSPVPLKQFPSGLFCLSGTGLSKFKGLRDILLTPQPLLPTLKDTLGLSGILLSFSRLGPSASLLRSKPAALRARPRLNAQSKSFQGQTRKRCRPWKLVTKNTKSSSLEVNALDVTYFSSKLDTCGSALCLHYVTFSNKGSRCMGRSTF